MKKVYTEEQMAYRRKAIRKYQDDPKNKEKVNLWRQINRKHKTEKLREIVNEYKKSHSCVDCGYSDYRALDLHHLDPSNKLTEVARIVQNRLVGYKRLQEEIDKCIVLCANCHRIHHCDERQSEKLLNKTLA